MLVVEDDAKLARAIGRGLKLENYAVDVTHDGREGLERASSRGYDAVVLDVLLPGMDGYELCRALRERDGWVPILMLTALGEVGDRIRGLDLGADDYLVKPFDFGELLARLRALIRRGPSERPAVIEVGALRADPLTRIVTYAGEETELTPREFELLTCLARRAGEVVSREQLLEAVWSAEQPRSANVVDVYLGYVRRKLQRRSAPPLIRTVRGAGFVLVA